MNKNTEYEKFTQEIYQGLLNNENITTVVKHNIQLKGKATKHQVDVYWEYIIAGVKHKVIIECKNYTKNLSLNLIRSFHSVLRDTGNVTGILVTKVGFQKGVKKYAEYYGIKLIILRVPKNEDWNGRIKETVTKTEIIDTLVSKISVKYDYDWCLDNLPKEMINSIETKFLEIYNENWIYDEKGNKLENFQNLKDKLPLKDKNLSENNYSYKFENAFFQSKNLGQIKIKEIRFTYNSTIEKYKWISDSEKTTKAILKDALSNEIKFIHKIYT